VYDFRHVAEIDMERRIGMRARTDFRVIATNGVLRTRCRGIEVSTSGIVLDRGHPVIPRDAPIFLNLELCLPERMKTLSAVARPVWSFSTQQALRFVTMSDVDRLTLAEHLDIASMKGTLLC
jgi:hypothetical protein